MLFRKPYLKELVRYIHLNPLRAGIVQDLKALDRYPYAGHGALVGTRSAPWQNDQAVLALFDAGKATARKRYHRFMEAGVDQGRRDELTGGGLIRSAGGWTNAAALRKTGALFKSDERILGDGDFVQMVLDTAQESLAPKQVMAGQGVDFNALLQRIAQQTSLSTEAILSPSKARPRVRARSLLCYLAARCLGMTMTELSRRMGVTVAAVSIAVGRAERSVQAGEIDLEKILKLYI
jgi:hypothetical protein